MIQAQENIMIQEEQPFELLLDRKYWIFSGLIFIKILSLVVVPQLSFINYVLVAFVLGNLVYYFNRPKELLFVFIAFYYSDMRDWSSRFEVVGGATRILLLDFFFIALMGIMLLHFLKVPKIYSYYLKWLVMLITGMWLFNFVRGVMVSPIGYVIGEGRFYFAAILVVMGVRLLRTDAEQSVLKIMQIVSLCSLYVCFYVILMVAMGKPYESGRYSPGNSEVLVIFLGLLTCFLEIHYNRRFHVLPYNKYLMALIYLGIIFLAGVRSIIIVTVLASGYFLFISSKVNLFKKISIVVGFVVFGVIALQFEATQKVLAFQTEFLEIVQGGGNKHSRTSSDFRQLMWGIFWDNIKDDPERLIIGRPFDNEQIDISSLHWQHKEGNDFVDNSLAHNDFLAITMTNGLVFTILLLTLLSLYGIKCLLVSRKSRQYAPIFIFLGVAMLSQIFQSATNAEIKHYQFSITLWFYIGVIAATLSYFYQNQHQIDKPL